MTRISKDVRDEIKLYQAQDYEIKEETPGYVLMQKPNKQSGWVHFWLAVFTIGVGNIVYWAVKHFNPKTKKIMK